MTDFRNKHRIGFLALAGGLVLTLILSVGCKGKNRGAITSLEQLGDPGRRIAVPGDMLEFKTLKEDYPDAEVLAYDDHPMAYEDVAKGRLDAFVYSRRQMELAIESGTAGVRLLEENYNENIVAAGISPKTQIPDLQNRFNAFLGGLKKDGTLDDVYDRWVIQADDTMPEIDTPVQPVYHLRVGTTGTVRPYSFYVGTDLRGYDIEIAYRFAAWLGADVEFKIYDYNGIVAAAATGDVDLILSDLYKTPEKEESIDFSDPLFIEEITAMVRDDGTVTPSSRTVSWQDYNGKRLGVLVGPLMEDAAAEYFPDSEYLYYNNYPDCIAALTTGKIDAFLGDEPGMKSIHAEQPQIDYIHDNITENNYSFAFRKDDPESAALCEEFNAFLAESWENGTMQEIDEIWFGTDEERKTVDMSDLTGENGTIRVVTTSTDMPFSYIKDGKNVGYDIDLVVRFCRESGYALELGDVDFAGRIPAVQSGKFDFTTDMNVTPEREEQVLFSDPTSHGGIVLAVRASDLEGANSGNVTKLEDLEKSTIGVLSGSMIPQIVDQSLPDAKIRYFNTTADAVNALRSRKVDAVAVDEPVARNMTAENDTLSIVTEHLETMDYAFALGRNETGDALKTELDEFLKELKDNGTLQELQQKWFESADLSAVQMTDYRDYPAENGILKVATFQYPPFSMLNEEMFAGYEIELLALFCKDRGYALDVTESTADAVLSEVQSGKCDIAASGVTVTQEREESVLFTQPDYTGNIVLVVRKDGTSAKGGFLSSIGSSFEKTFIREKRWQLFLKGIGTTMLITVLSVLFGTILGFLVFMMCRHNNPVANRITRFCVWLVQGMPVVVLLMILYYVIFGRVAISGAAVSVMGFTLVFGSAVYAMLRSGVGAIDKGQLEAAYALGYTDRRAFFRIILPQALPHFMPAYKGELTALVKATAVVGYVAVQDLTKMGDIVRSRTYEAFFPLIAVAVIYYLLAAVLTILINKIEIRIDPRKRVKKQILKGVKTDD